MIAPTLNYSTFTHAADIYRIGRSKGKTIRSSFDCLIAAIAIENKIPLFHQERDYNQIVTFTSLKIFSYPK